MKDNWGLRRATLNFIWGGCNLCDLYFAARASGMVRERAIDFVARMLKMYPCAREDETNED